MAAAKLIGIDHELWSSAENIATDRTAVRAEKAAGVERQRPFVIEVARSQEAKILYALGKFDFLTAILTWKAGPRQWSKSVTDMRHRLELVTFTWGIAMAENRTKVRARASTPGRVILDKAGVEVPCTALDLSAEGACLLFRAGVEVPTAFQLRVGFEPDFRRVEVRWRRGDRVGVLFAEPRRAPDVLAL